MHKIYERHRLGIIGTLLFHTLLLGFAYMSEVKQYPPETFQVLVDPETLSETPEEEVERLKEELSKEVDKLYNQMQHQEQMKNVAIDKDNEEQKPTELKKEMSDEEYEREIVRNAMGEKDFEKYVENKPTLDDEVDEPIKKSEQKKEPQKSAYKGPATVVYFLEGRKSIFLDIPVYTCEGAAKVIVIIDVNPQGNVLKAVIDDQNSILATDCYRNAAIQSATNALFSSVSTNKGIQSGSIVFHFIAQ